MVSGKPQRALEAMRRTAQIVFQNPDSSLNPRMTIHQILARPLEGREVNVQVRYKF